MYSGKIAVPPGGGGLRDGKHPVSYGILHRPQLNR
jgi:hypothetical protein